MFRTATVTSATGEDCGASNDEAARLWALGVREVVLTHCIDVFDDAGHSWRAQEDAEGAFENQMNAFEARHMKVRTEVPLGHPAMSLREVSKSHGAGLIVVQAGDTALFGSGLPEEHGSDLIALGETPVLVCPRESSGQTSDSITDRILFATDFSQTANRAFGTLLGVVKGCRGSVDLLHVQEPATLEYGTASESSEYDRASAVGLSRLKERLLAAGAEHVTTEVVSAVAVDELGARTQSGVYSLVVMGSRGRSGQSSGVLGDVSGPLVRRSGVPILLVPPANESAADSSAVRRA